MPKPDPSRLRRTGAVAVVFDGQGRILFQRRTDNGMWCLPGGSVEVGETAMECITWEVREETGYQVEVVRLIGIYSAPDNTTVHYPDGGVVAYVSLCFECRILGGAAALSDETSEVAWFEPTRLPEPLLSNHVIRIQDALARQREAFFR
jgi:8-oxo-dGTP pyrophosphatase MutT (NUDIX family)